MPRKKRPAQNRLILWQQLDEKTQNSKSKYSIQRLQVYLSIMRSGKLHLWEDANFRSFFIKWNVLSERSFSWATSGDFLKAPNFCNLSSRYNSCHFSSKLYNILIDRWTSQTTPTHSSESFEYYPRNFHNFCFCRHCLSFNRF